MNPEQIAQIVSIAAGAVQNAAQPASPGWKTSEFWLHIVSLVPMVLGVALGASNPVTLGVGAVATIGAAVYTASRSGVKSSAAQVAASAAPAIAKAITDSVATAPKA